MKENRTRLQVTLNKDTADGIAKIADMMGVTSSQLCAVWIGQFYATYERGFSAFENTLQKAITDIKKGGENA